MSRTFKHQRLFDERAYYKEERNLWKAWAFIWRFEFGITKPPPFKSAQKNPDVPYKWYLTKRSWCRKDQWRKHRRRWDNALRTQNWDRMEKLSIKPTNIWWIID